MKGVNSITVLIGIIGIKKSGEEETEVGQIYLTIRFNTTLTFENLRVHTHNHKYFWPLRVAASLVFINANFFSIDLSSSFLHNNKNNNLINEL